MHVEENDAAGTRPVGSAAEVGDLIQHVEGVGVRDLVRHHRRRILDAGAPRAGAQRHLGVDNILPDGLKGLVCVLQFGARIRPGVVNGQPTADQG